MKSAEAFDVMEPDGPRDALGRRRWSPARREELVREFGLGGVTPAAFARKHGLSYTTFVTWLRRGGIVDDAKPRACVDVVDDEDESYASGRAGLPRGFDRVAGVRRPRPVRRRQRAGRN